MLRKQGRYQNLMLAAAIAIGLSAVGFLILKGGRALSSGGFALEIAFPAVKNAERKLTEP